MERCTVSSGMTLTVEYGSKPKACELLLAPEQSLVEVKHPGPLMSSKGESAVLDELLPVTTRGNLINSETVQVEDNALLKTDYETYPSGDFAVHGLCFFQRKSGRAHLGRLHTRHLSKARRVSDCRRHERGKHDEEAQSLDPVGVDTPLGCVVPSRVEG